MTILVAEEHGRLASGAALGTPVSHLASATGAGNDRSSGMKPDELGRALSGALSGPLGGEVRVEGLARLSGGASRETWAFDPSGPDGVRHAFILRKDFEGSASQGLNLLLDESERFDRAGEYALCVVLKVAEER